MKRTGAEKAPVLFFTASSTVTAAAIIKKYLTYLPLPTAADPGLKVQ